MFARELARILVLKAHEAGRQPRLHPNGFVQLDLTIDGRVRFHVWPETPIEAQATRHTIHDHNFDMESIVLRGKLRNLVYETAETPSEAYAPGAPIFAMHAVHSIGGADTILKPLPEMAYSPLKVLSGQQYETGQSYYLPAAVLHDTETTGLTATIMTKVNFKRDYRPRVAVPMGVKPDNAFRRQEKQNWLYEIIAEALELPIRQ
jgi:hypothetical protein